MITAQRTVPVSGRVAARLVPALPSSHRTRTSVVRRFRYAPTAGAGPQAL